MLDWLDPRSALHISRILQEAFANILKRTQASEIRMTTSAGNCRVCVGITEQRQGFAVERALGNGGRGLSTAGAARRP